MVKLPNELHFIRVLSVVEDVGIHTITKMHSVHLFQAFLLMAPW